MTDQQKQIYAALVNTILNNKTDSPLLVAISGKDGSGKTTMADILAQFLSSKTHREVIRISVDDFMNPRSVRYTPTSSAGRGCYDYTFNWTAFIENVLQPLQKDDSRKYRTKVFDHPTDSVSLSPLKTATQDAIIVIDGVFLYKHELIDYWDIKILLSTDDKVAIERGARRDAERLGSYEMARQKYIDRYIASQTIYYSEEQPEEHADIIIDNNDVTSPHVLT